MPKKAARSAGPDIEFTLADVKPLPPRPVWNFVTAFWYGYVHQDSLDGARRFMVSAAAQTAPGGAFLHGLCDPGDVFETIPRSYPIVNGGALFLDAVI